MPAGGAYVLGADLNCSESSIWRHKKQEVPAAIPSIHNNSGLPQGPVDPAIGRLDLRQTDCAMAVAGWYDWRGTVGGSPHVQHEAARVHHSPRRRGSHLAASGAGAAVGDAGDRIPRLVG